MNIRTVKIILIGLGAAAIIFAVAGIFPLMSDIQKESQSFLFQKKERINLAVRTGNLSDVEDIPFDRPFVGPIDPFDFVDFLEEEAELSGLSIVIERQSYKAKLWDASDFTLKLSGSPAGFLSFLEKMESTNYLIHIVEFKILKGEEENMIKGSLSGKVYGKVF